MSFDGWNDELYHHGVLGMKWGVRKYQNEDGSLTAAGKKRYSRSPEGLGYKPLKGTRGDIVQRSIGRDQIFYNKKQGRLSKKLDKVIKKDNGLESGRSSRLRAKLERVAERIDLAKKMQDVYANAAKSDRNRIKGNMIVAKSATLLLGTLGIGASLGSYSLIVKDFNRLLKDKYGKGIK